jgi:hypothetical protein
LLVAGILFDKLTIGSNEKKYLDDLQVVFSGYNAPGNFNPDINVKRNKVTRAMFRILCLIFQLAVACGGRFVQQAYHRVEWKEVLGRSSSSILRLQLSWKPQS